MIWNATTVWRLFLPLILYSPFGPPLHMAAAEQVSRRLWLFYLTSGVYLLRLVNGRILVGGKAI